MSQSALVWLENYEHRVQCQQLLAWGKYYVWPMKSFVSANVHWDFSVFTFGYAKSNHAVPICVSITSFTAPRWARPPGFLQTICTGPSVNGCHLERFASCILYSHTALWHHTGDERFHLWFCCCVRIVLWEWGPGAWPLKWYHAFITT